MSNPTPNSRAKANSNTINKIKRNREIVGERIKEAYERYLDFLNNRSNPDNKGLNRCPISEITKATGISESRFWRYRNGKADVPPYDLLELANYFNVSADYLIGRIDLPFDSVPSQRLALKLGLELSSFESIRRLFRADGNYRLVLNAFFSEKLTGGNIVAESFIAMMCSYADLCVEEEKLREKNRRIEKVKEDYGFDPKSVSPDNFTLAQYFEVKYQLEALKYSKEKIILDLYDKLEPTFEAIAAAYLKDVSIIDSINRHVKAWDDEFLGFFIQYARVYGTRKPY